MSRERMTETERRRVKVREKERRDGPLKNIL